MPITSCIICDFSMNVITGMYHMMFFSTDVEKNLLTLWESKPHKIPCYASLHVCGTFCYAYVNVNTHFEALVYELLIEHTPITTILIEHKLKSRIYF